MGRRGTAFLLPALAMAAAPPAVAGESLKAPGPPRYEGALTLERRSHDPVEESSPETGGHRVTGIGLSVARYWSCHHRTELSLSATGGARFQTTYDVAGRVQGALVSHEYRHQLASLAHVVQLRRNKWVHPQLGLGVSLDIERRKSWLEPSRPEFSDGFVYPTLAEQQRALEAHPSRTQARLTPFGEAALKVYVTRRAFVRVAGRMSPVGSAPGWSLHASAGRDW